MAGGDVHAALARAGAELCARVVEAVPGWVRRCVEERLPPGADRVALAADTAAAGRRAQVEVRRHLGALLGAPVDAQRATPLEVVRAAVAFPTAVLRGARVPAVARDRFAVERFPDDVYDLTPSSLEALDPALAEPAVAWGAAKAMAHRRRHRGP